MRKMKLYISSNMVSNGKSDVEISLKAFHRIDQLLDLKRVEAINCYYNINGDAIVLMLHTGSLMYEVCQDD